MVATTDRRVLKVSTSDGTGRPRLRVERSFSVADAVPRDDCLIALMPDWAGRIWFVTQDGRVGTVDPDSGRVAVRDLGEEVANSLAVDEGGVYVVTVGALYRMRADAAGRPSVTWRATYDRGSRSQPGQLSQGSGTTPTVLPGGRVAITDNAEPRMHVAFYDTTSGRLVCRAPVFARGPAPPRTRWSRWVTGWSSRTTTATPARPAPFWGVPPRPDSPGSTSPGTAAGHVDQCRDRPDVGAESLARQRFGLRLHEEAHAWGVSAWYLTAIDVRTGRTAFSVRTGLGTLMNNHYSAITLAPDGSAYVATLAGMVRVRDGR